jgi:hypothetical protein
MLSMHVLRLLLIPQATVAALGFLHTNKQLYSARPILISGTCKRENGHDHAALLTLLVRAINEQFNKIATETGSCPSRVVSIASDGETRRGCALVEVAMCTTLAPSSMLYNLLEPLRFMNLLVGEDEITADKDYKHVFKRIRCKEIRLSGIAVIDQIITPSAIQAHLLSTGVVSSQHIQSTFRPDDKQDVPLAIATMQDLISLSPAPEASTPAYIAMRAALNILGQVFKYILYPYICLDLSLSEQLEYLSAAAHLLLLLYRTNGNRFFPNLLYTDIMIMIKNVYFCVGKAKINNPLGSFFIILLGTDRLETLFGIIRSMIGTDCGVDALQLGERTTSTAHVAEILGKHPEWDSSPRRMRLTLITREGTVTGKISSKVDHFSPSMWIGDTSLATVNLQTSWLRGFSLCIENSRLESIRPQLLNLNALDDTGIDILRPLGTLLIRAMNADDDDDDDDDEEREDLAAIRAYPEVAGQMDGIASLPEIEDAVAAEEAAEIVHRTFLPTIILPNGDTVPKGKLLANFMQFKKTVTSADRLKRYQNITRFDSSACPNTPESRFDIREGEPILSIGDPVVSLLQCDGVLFLCVAEALDITIDSSPVSQIPANMLSDIAVLLTYQLVKLVPATTDDDPTNKHDWCSRHGNSTGMNLFKANVPGRLIQTINPTLSDPPLPQAGLRRERPFYLLDSQTLIALTASFTNRIASSDAKLIPRIVRSSHFPYIKAGKQRHCAQKP